MADELHNLLNAFRFGVQLNGEVIGFKSISGIKLVAAYEPLQVGGMNDGPMMLPIPVKESGRLTLMRGKYSDKPKVLPLPGTQVSEMSITLYDDSYSPIVDYTLESPVVESIELGTLDAMSSEVLIETLTVAFRCLKEK